MISIKKITEKDFKTVESISYKIFKTDYTTTYKDGIWWLVYDDNKPVGFAGLYYYDTIEKPAGFLCLSGILPEYRGKGLQRRLIYIREKQARLDGYNRMISYTSYDNLPSANNLIKTGYRLYKPSTKWGVEYALYFEKEL